MTLKILHVLDHSIPLHSGYTFRTRSILKEQRRLGWETCGRRFVEQERSWPISVNRYRGVYEQAIVRARRA